MNRAQIRILKQMHQKRLGGFLKGLDGVGLPAQLGAYFGRKQVERNFTHETRKGEFEKKEVEGALVFADFFEGDGARLVAAAAACRGWVAGFIELVKDIS